MKKTLLPLLLSSVLFADCTPQQEQRANTLWKESRKMQGMEKITLLNKAEENCSMSKITVDIHIYTINKHLDKNNLPLKSLSFLTERISIVQSMNSNLSTKNKESYKSTNSHMIDKLKSKLREKKQERNENKLISIDRFKNPSVDEIKKGAKRGFAIPIPLEFSHNKDVVINNSNINKLAKALHELVLEDENSTFIITGYASGRGKPNYNQKLSENRAYNTKLYIEEKYPKIKGRIDSSGKGETDLICSEGFAEDSQGDGNHECLTGIENENSTRRVEVIKK